MKVQISLATLLLSATLFVSCSDKKQKEEVYEETTTGDTLAYDEEVATEEPSDVAVEQSSEDWDVALKSYEEYIDQYIKLMKKAKQGDTSAMSEYPEMMEKANELSEKMSNAGNEMTPAQLKKFTELQTKLANAAMKMQ